MSHMICSLTFQLSGSALIFNLIGGHEPGFPIGFPGVTHFRFDQIIENRSVIGFRITISCVVT